MHVEVALPLPIPLPFTYAVPEDLRDRATRGCRALVPFGSRRLTGIIVGHVDEPQDVETIKPILGVLDEVPSFTDELLDMARWIADYYVCSLGEVVRAMLPPGASGKDGGVTSKVEKHIRFAPSYRHASAADELRETLRGAKQIAVVESLAGFRSEGDTEPRKADLLERAGASHATVQSLLKRGIVEAVEKEVLRTPYDDEPVPTPAAVKLHAGQEAALKKIADAIEAHSFHAFLLHGVTGSGKTQVYIEALKRVLELGKTGIILVPEIALTPQTVSRFRAHFGDRIAVFHSRMSQGERFDAWRALRDGRFDVVIGPRSAVLVPLTNLGLIVVDEEHESSYKQQDPAPRYHARDVAVMRAHTNGAVCVLGSATPSLETYLNAQSDKYVMLEMPDRVPHPDGEAVALPKVRITDLRVERNQQRLHGVFSGTLIDAIEERLQRKEQVILLQNRRGYAPLLQCQDCGWTPECPDCSVTLTAHKSRRHLRCHYCGRTARVPRLCPGCDHEDSLDMLGSGTQRVEEELQELLPTARLIRMDLDTTTGKNAHERLLRQFGDRKADILLGTQMVAKGLDFGNVTLVGVINADLGAMLPDFRSEERTFQLLSQVSGRAGRAALPGEVIIQTRNPDRPIIRYARDHDYAAFAAVALAERRDLGYPPFGRMAAAEFKGPNEGKVANLAREWTSLLQEHVSDTEVLGPEPAFISRVKKQYRYHTILKARRHATLHDVLRSTQKTFGNPPSGCRVNIDVDPIGLF